MALLFVWWLKPLYDRVVLHVLSRAVFGEVQSPRQVLGAAREWLGTGLAMALTFGRFDTARSFNLPVRQLEGQRARAGRERRGVLGRRVSSYATWLTIVCLHFEAVLYWSLGRLTSLALPAKANEGQDFFSAFFAGDIFGYGDVLAYAAAVLLLEPFYVAAGFALYLNRRTLLEGWDIEVALRKITQRHAAVVMLAVCCMIPMVCFSQEHREPKNPRREIAEVLKAKEFPHQVDTMQWQRRNPLEQADRPAREREGGDYSWLGALGYALANAARVLFWLLAAAAIAYALWWAARMLPRLRAPVADAYRPPASLFGMEIAPEKLPGRRRRGRPGAGARRPPARGARPALSRLALRPRTPPRRRAARQPHRARGAAARDAARRSRAQRLPADAGAHLARVRLLAPGAGAPRGREPCRRIPRDDHVKTRLILGGIVLALAIGVVVWWNVTFVRVPAKVWVGPSGEARLRQFLAAERFAERMGLAAKELRSLPEVDALAPGGVLIMPRRRQLLDSPRMDRILAWVQAGGHLIAEAEAPGVSDPLFDLLAVRRIDAPALTDALVVTFADGAALKVSLRGRLGLEPPTGRLLVRAAQGETVRLASFSRGRGAVTVATSLDFARNPQIGDQDHAEVLWRLMRATPATHLAVYWRPARLSLWGFLTEHAAGSDRCERRSSRDVAVAHRAALRPGRARRAARAAASARPPARERPLLLGAQPARAPAGRRARRGATPRAARTAGVRRPRRRRSAPRASPRSRASRWAKRNVCSTPAAPSAAPLSSR